MRDVPIGCSIDQEGDVTCTTAVLTRIAGHDSEGLEEADAHAAGRGLHAQQVTPHVCGYADHEAVARKMLRQVHVTLPRSTCPVGQDDERRAGSADRAEDRGGHIASARFIAQRVERQPLEGVRALLVGRGPRQGRHGVVPVAAAGRSHEGQQEQEEMGEG